MEIAEKIQLLRTELEQHNYNYYVLSAPVITDFEFDAKMKQLQKLEAEHPEFFDPNSPTQRVGNDIAAALIRWLTFTRCSRSATPIPKAK